MLRVICLLTWIFSLHAYFIMFVAFILARKNLLVRLSGSIAGLATIWVFASVALRLGVAPSLEFWFKLSTFSLSLIPFVIYLILRCISHERLMTGEVKALMVLSLTMALFCLTDFYYDYEFVYFSESWLGGMNIADLYEVSVTPKLGSLFIIGGESIIIFLCIRKLIRNRDIEYRRLFLGASFLYWFSGILSIAIPSLFPFEILGGLVNVIMLLFLLRERNALKMELFIKPQLFPIFSVIMVLVFCVILNLRNWGDVEPFRPAVIFTMAITAVVGTLMTLFYEYLYTKFFTDRGNYLLKCSTLYHEELMEELGDVDAIADSFINIIPKSFGKGDIALYVYDEDEQGYALKNPGKYDTHLFTVNDDIIRKISTFPGIANASNVMDLLPESSLLYKEIAEGYIRWVTPFNNKGLLFGFFFGGGFNTHTIEEMDKETLLGITKVTSLALQETYMMHKVAHDALRDDLTDLYSRSVIKDKLSEKLLAGKPFVVMLFSIDDLGVFNMVYNQSDGDELIHVFSTTLKSVAPESTILGRTSGKTFVAILECSVVEAIEFDEELRTSFRLANADNIRNSITFSTGLLEVTDSSGYDPNRIIGETNRALVIAKKNGKNQLKVYEGELDADESLADSEFKIKTVEAILKALDLKDHFTYSHSINVASYARAIAEATGLDPLECETIYQAGLVHDIGKISIPDSVLLNPGRLNKDEYEIIKTHVDRSEEVIRSLPLGFRMLPIALAHHERWDGKGYPNGLSGFDIPIGGRCLAIADTFDAMTSRRVYKRALSIDEALEEILKCSGTQFDPDLGPLFVKLVKDGVVTPHPYF